MGAVQVGEPLRQPRRQVVEGEDPKVVPQSSGAAEGRWQRRQAQLGGFVAVGAELLGGGAGGHEGGGDGPGGRPRHLGERETAFAGRL